MPFGAKNAGACYNCFVELILQKLRSPYVLSYLDDVIIHTDTINRHLDVLKKMFQVHREGGIRLRASKTHLFQSEVDYLGFQVTAEGINMYHIISYLYIFVSHVLQFFKSPNLT